MPQATMSSRPAQKPVGKTAAPTASRPGVSPSRPIAASPVAHAGATSFAIRDQSYAVGLFWQTTSHAASIRDEARRTAANEGTRADLYCTRPVGKLTQWALGDNKAGHLPGHLAAAAVVASYARKLDAQSWSAAFRLHTGHYWFTSGSDGLIDPEGDVIVASAADLQKMVLRSLRAEARDLLILPTGQTAPAGFAGKVSQILFHRIPPQENPVKLVDIKLQSTLSVSRAKTLGQVLSRYLPYAVHRHIAKYLG